MANEKKKSTFFSELSILILLFSELSYGLSKNIQSTKAAKLRDMECHTESTEKVYGPSVYRVWSESQCSKTGTYARLKL